MAGDRLATTVCGLCPYCGMRGRVKNGRIDKIKGDPDHPANSGALCIKGSVMKELVYAPERLRHQLHKTRGGFKKISGEEALDLIAHKLSEIKDQYGPHTLLRFGGAPVTEATRDAFAQPPVHPRGQARAGQCVSAGAGKEMCRDALTNDVIMG